MTAHDSMTAVTTITQNTGVRNFCRHVAAIAVLHFTGRTLVLLVACAASKGLRGSWNFVCSKGLRNSYAGDCTDACVLSSCAAATIVVCRPHSVRQHANFKNFCLLCPWLLLFSVQAGRMLCVGLLDGLIKNIQ
jgi:hypothetical protein